MRVCIVYDCLYPHTVGGGERWYRALAERLTGEGHEVDYLTLCQWPDGEEPELAGVHVIAVGPRMELYVHGRRRIVPPLRFGLGVFAHLARHGARYDAVHTMSFPFFPLLAAAALQRRRGYVLVVDWFELWSKRYWQSYLGRRGIVGWQVRRLCLHVPQRAFCFSRRHELRLRAEGVRGEVTRLRGLHAGAAHPAHPAPAAVPPLAVYAGRHIPEKRIPSFVAAVARARETLPTLRAAIYGDGPERATVQQLVVELGLDEAVVLPGFVPQHQLERSLARALCLVLPSRREGYGLVVVEAASLGTPSIVVDDLDNAAVELVEDGVNGVVAPSDSADDIAAAIVRVHAAGADMREGTRAWFDRHRDELSLAGSLDHVAAAYGRR